MTPRPPLPWLRDARAALLGRRDALPHALLLVGPPGIGTSSLALDVAHSLLCESPDAQGGACGRCLACGWLAQDSHPDFRRVSPIDDEAAERAGPGVKASKDIRIQQIRELAGFVGVGTHRGGRRLVVIDPADAMTNEAANALLKTLEEPSRDTHFIVVARRLSSLPATILSRCVRVSLSGPSSAQAGEWLRAEAGLDPAVAEGVLAAANGSPLHAMRLADAEAGAAYRSILDAVSRLPDTGVAVGADTLALRPASDWIDVLQAWVADLGRCRLGAAPLRFPSQSRRLDQLAARLSASHLAAFAAWLDRQRAVAQHPLNARLFCESVLMRYQAVYEA